MFPRPVLLAVTTLACVLWLAPPAPASGSPGVDATARAPFVPPLISRHWQPDAPVGTSEVISRTQIGSISFGRARIEDSTSIDFGTGGLEYSVNRPGYSGWIYGRPPLPRFRPVMAFADTKFPSDCSGSIGPVGYAGYVGVSNICAFRGIGDHVFIADDDPRGRYWTLHFGDRQSDCYAGLLLFRQAGKYGAIDPVDVDDSSGLIFDWWYDDSGGSDFSALCAPSATATPPVLPILLPLLIQPRRARMSVMSGSG